MAAECCCPPRPDDPAEQLECPRSGTKGYAVDLNTVKALLTSTALGRITGSPHRFCPDPACEIVYFSPGDTYTVRDRTPSNACAPTSRPAAAPANCATHAACVASATWSRP